MIPGEMTRRAPRTEPKTAPAPPAGVVVRPLTLDDAPGVAELISARDRADFGEERPIAFSAEGLRAWWEPRANRLATDAWAVLAGDRIVGFAEAQREGG